ncbi:hypothetical protein ACFL22_00215 [Patescibacteria group bacterium]
MNIFSVQTVHAATVQSGLEPLIDKIIDNIINPLIGFLFALALVLFIWGIARFLFQANDEGAREQGKKHIMWGLFGMFIMVSVMGVINLLANTFGF